MESEFPHNDGTIKWFYLRKLSVPERVFITSPDITNNKLFRLERNKVNDNLEQNALVCSGQLTYTNKELEAFSYSISHDLHAHLRHVNRFIDLLKSKSGDKLDQNGNCYFNNIGFRNSNGTAQRQSRLADFIKNRAYFD